MSSTAHAPRGTLVVAIAGFSGQGGTEHQIVDIATGMQERGWTTILMSRRPVDPHNGYVRALRAASVEVIPRWLAWESLPYRRYLHRRLRKAMVRKDKTDAWRWQGRRLARLRAPTPVVVHELPYFGRLPYGALRIHQRLRLPVVHTILGTPLAPVIPAADWAILTTDGAPTIAGGRSATWIPCMTLKAGGDERRQANQDGDETAHFAPRDGIIRLLFVGRVSFNKGLDILLEAMRAAPANVSLTVVGDGVDYQDCVARAAALGRQVAFTGSLDRDGVFREIARAHALVVPSRSAEMKNGDGMPTVVSEALALGRPVLATAVGGVGRVLGGADAPGWLIPPDQPQALAEQIRTLNLGDIGARSLAAKTRYRHMLHPSVVLDAYERCYAAAVVEAQRASGNISGSGRGQG